MAIIDKAAMSTTNISAFSSRIAAANSFLSINSTIWVVGKASIVEYLLYLNSFFANHIFALKKMSRPQRNEVDLGK